LHAHGYCTIEGLQALGILFGASFTVAVCIAAGGILLRDVARDWAVRFVVGAAIMSGVVFGLSAMRLVYPGAFLAAGVIALAWSSRYRPARRPLPHGRGSVTRCKNAGVFLSRARQRAVLALFQHPAKLPRAATAAFLVFFILYFFNAMAPEISYDGSRYHLGLVGRYFREHGFHRITTNMYASLTQGVEMLYLFAYTFGRHSAAAMVHFAFLVALAWMIYDYARRAGYPHAGNCAALLVFASPMVGVDGTCAYNDVAVAGIAFALFYLLQMWNLNRQARLLPAIGLLAGFAYAAKYTAWLAVPYALGFVAWKGRRLRDTTVVAICAALLIVPWMAKNWLWVQNPLAPFYNHWFPNPYVTVAFEREYRQNMALYNLGSWWEIPMQVTVHGSLSGLLGPVFLLSPIALYSLRSREGRQLLLAALVFGANYFANIGTRFLIPPLAFVALAMAIALNGMPRLLMSIALAHAFLSWPSIMRQYSRFDAWHLVKVPYREALRIKPEEGFLESNLPLYGAARMVERNTPPGSTIFTFTSMPEAYTSRNVLVAYQSAGNIVTRLLLWSGFLPVHAPKARLQFTFPRQSLRAVRLVQTNLAPSAWSIHELRLLDGTRELARDSRWRATADPSPWGIEQALDRNPVTFWICGENLRPGQFMQVDFAEAEAMDNLLLEAAPNQPDLRLRLEGQDAGGVWRRLSETPELTEIADLDYRRSVSAEVRKRGIDYLLMFDGEFGADEFRRNTEAWGMRLAGEYRGGRLYQLP
jgi:dolichyl-phosphate-mannose-protein mannosyltransferase